MAKVSPYWDGRAHGSLADCLTFRVFRGKTRLSKKNRPRGVASAGQLVQRTKFKAATDAYNVLNSEWRTFLYDRGVSTYQRGRELFIRAHIKDTLPSLNPGITMDRLDDVVLFNPAGIDPLSLKITIGDLLDTFGCTIWNQVEGPTSGIPMHDVKEVTAVTIDSTIASGANDLEWYLTTVQTPPLAGMYHVERIYDNANVPLGGSVVAPYTVFMFIVINQTVSTPYTIPDDYSITFTYKDFSDVPHTVTVKFPEIDLTTPGTRVDLYVDTTWALYDAWPLTTPVKVNSTITDVTSQIGPDATSSAGLSFYPVKFNNGTLINEPGQTLDFTPITLANAGIIGFWFKPVGWSITDGLGDLDTCSMFTWKHPTVYNFMEAYFGDTNGQWYWYNGSHYVVFDFSGSTFDVADGELCHLLFAWNQDGIAGGSDTMRVYKNKTLVDSFTGAMDDMTLQDSNILQVGNNLTGLHPCRSYLDNVKVYPGTTRLTDILDYYDQESFPGWNPLGFIYDSENVFTQTAPVQPGPAGVITIENNLGNPERIPMDYLVTLHWYRDPDDYGTTKIRLPKLDMPGYGGVTLYLAADGSAYWDVGMTQIASTPKMYYAKTT